MKTNEMYYFVTFETAEGFARWSKFKSETEVDEFLNKAQDDEDIATIKYISKKPETYLEWIRRINNNEEKVINWNLSVAEKTLEKIKERLKEM